MWTSSKRTKKKSCAVVVVFNINLILYKNDVCSGSFWIERRLLFFRKRREREVCILSCVSVKATMN